MEFERFKRVYLIGAVIVWLGIIAAVTYTLAGTPYLPIILILLGGGAVWFVVIIPGAMQSVRQS